MIEHLLHLLSGDLGRRIGWSLLHFLWQGAVVAALLGVALPVLRAARLRYVAACAAMVALLTLPVLTAVLIAPSPRASDVGLNAANTNTPIASLPPDMERTLTWNANMTAENSTPAVSPPPESPSQPWFPRVDTFLPWAVLAWLAGVLALSLWHASGWMVLHRLRRSGRPVEGALANLFQRLLKRLGVKHAVRLLESAAVRTPAVIGFLRPVILFPASALTGLSTAQIEAILIHELAHVRRWDGLARRIQAAAETVLFFHPAVWWVSARMTQESETCCDEIAVAMSGDRQSYAQALAQVAGAWPELAPAASGGKLLPRLRRILGVTTETRTWRAAAGATAALIVLGVILVVSCTNNEAEIPGETNAAESVGHDDNGRDQRERKDFNVYIGGEIARPGAFHLTDRPINARQAIAAAGGLTSDSQKKNMIVRLYRRDEQNRESISEMNADALLLGQIPDVHLQDHDLLLVLDADKVGKANLDARHTIIAAPRAGEPGEFYIHGEVRRPGVYSLTGMLTVKQVLLTAGFAPEDAGQTVLMFHRTGKITRGPITPHPTDENVYVGTMSSTGESFNLDPATLFDGSAADRFVQPDDELEVMTYEQFEESMRAWQEAAEAGIPARFVATMSRTRELCTAMFVYAADNHGTFPPDLETLVTKNILKPDRLYNLNMPSRKPGYVYVRPTKAWEEYENAGTVVVIYDNYDTWPEDGIVVGFLDGHVELVKSEAAFTKLLVTGAGVLRPAALGVTQAASAPSSAPSRDLSSEAPTVILEVHGEGETSEKAVFRFSDTDETLANSEALYKALKARFDALTADEAADGRVVIEYHNARWPFLVNAYNQAARAGFQNKNIFFRQGQGSDEERRNKLLAKIADDTQRIAKLRTQEIAAQAAVEAADKEDLRNSPEVLYALDVDLEIRALKQSKVHMETRYANLLRQFGPNHRDVQAANEQIAFLAQRIADGQTTVIVRTVNSIKPNRQAVLESIQEQLRTTLRSLEENENQLKAIPGEN